MCCTVTMTASDSMMRVSSLRKAAMVEWLSFRVAPTIQRRQREPLVGRHVCEMVTAKQFEHLHRLVADVLEVVAHGAGDVTYVAGLLVVFLDHIRTPALLRARSAQLFEWIADRKLKLRVGGVPLGRRGIGARRHGELQDPPASCCWRHRRG